MIGTFPQAMIDNLRREIRQKDIHINLLEGELRERLGYNKVDIKEIYAGGTEKYLLTNPKNNLGIRY